MASTMQPQDSRLPVAASMTPTIRSCNTCRQKRMKCNREQPCAGCVKSGTPCVFPPLERSTKKRRARNNPSLLNRLQALENSIDRLSSVALSNGESQPADVSTPASVTEDTRTKPDGPGAARLLVDQDTSRYFNNAFWSKLTDEVALHAFICPQNLPMLTPADDRGQGAISHRRV